MAGETEAWAARSPVWEEDDQFGFRHVEPWLRALCLLVELI